jgi:PadR family transcriptional regulator PadR
MFQNPKEINKEDMMKLLTRSEELVLLAVWRLKENAYCVPIREQLIEVSQKNWSFGSVYDALDRLEKKGFLTSYLSKPLKSRGGRSKRIYQQTDQGMQALGEIQNIHKRIWKGIEILNLEKIP